MNHIRFNNFNLQKKLNLNGEILCRKLRLVHNQKKSTINTEKNQQQKETKENLKKEKNILKQYDLKNKPFQVDPVLGDTKIAFIKKIRDEINNEHNLPYGFEKEEVEKIINGIEKSSLDELDDSTSVDDHLKSIERKKKIIYSVLSIKNTDLESKKKLAIKIALKDFQRHEGDTASPEVQAAVLTVKIHFGMDVVKQFFKDKVFIQQVRQMVYDRQSILKYLKRLSPERYSYTLKKLGLTDDVITREFHMDRKYMQDYKVWGDKKLIKFSPSQIRELNYYQDLRKKLEENKN